MLIQHRTLPSGGKIVSDVTMLLALTSCESNKKKLKEEEEEERERETEREYVSGQKVVDDLSDV